MAEVPVLPAAEGTVSAGKGKKWLIVGIVTALVLLGGGVSAWFLLSANSQPKKAEEKPKEPVAPPQFVALDPPFVVNFEGEQLVRFLQVTVQLMTRDPATVELLKANDPVVRNDLLLLFGNQKYAVVATREGKDHLRAEALTAVRKIVQGAGGKPDKLEQVYFTSFVMQ